MFSVQQPDPFTSLVHGPTFHIKQVCRQNLLWHEEPKGTNAHKHFPVCRPVPVHPPFRPDVGIRGEEPRGVHDGDATGAEDEEGLDAHGTKAVGTLWSR